MVDDLESIGVGIPESRLREASKILGIPTGDHVVFFDSAEVGLMIVAQPDGKGVNVVARGTFKPAVAARVVRELADMWERDYCTCGLSELGHVPPCEFSGGTR